MRHSIGCGGRAIRAFTCGVLVILLLTAQTAHSYAQSLVRDAEIEDTIRRWANPIFSAANLTPSSVQIYLVNDRSLNAFVAEGQNLFINTGTIVQLDRPRELIGIIAHETGHIAGGHLARTSDAVANATIPVIAGMLLGIAAMAAGAPDAGMAIMGGGQNIGMRSLLAYSRGQEASADQAAVNYLNATHQSPRGLLETFQKFADQEIMTSQHIDPFIQSHPLSQERINALENRVNTSPYADVEESDADKRAYARMKAKLVGFLDRPDVVLRRYPPSNQSVEARYARAIAAYRIPDLVTALGEMDSLIAQEPNNPYFHELRGQILLENGRPSAAIPSYQTAVKLSPGQPLLMSELGQALVATEDISLNKQAMQTLESSLDKDPENPLGWHQIAIAYARDGRVGMADYATAERLYRQGDTLEARRHADRALCALKPGTPAWRRAQDIAFSAQADIEKDDKHARRAESRAEKKRGGDGALRCAGSSDGATGRS